MPLGPNAYPAQDPNGGPNMVIIDPDAPEGQGTYQVDPSGAAVIPGEGAVNPDWTNPGKYGGKFAPPGAGAQNPNFFPNITKGVTDTTTGGLAGPGRGTPNTAGTNFTPYQSNVPEMPSVDVQPGLNAQQWEANYNLLLAAEKRLRETLEMVTEPQARAAIDQAINAIKQSNYGNQVNARESQSRMTGKIPRWLPQPPKPTMGEWKQYQTPGLSSPPGTPGAAPMADDQAAQAIWNHDTNLQSMYKGNHPTWTPLQAVQDWWAYAPHEGANSISEYAQKKGWS